MGTGILLGHWYIDLRRIIDYMDCVPNLVDVTTYLHRKIEDMVDERLRAAVPVHTRRAEQAVNPTW